MEATLLQNVIVAKAGTPFAIAPSTSTDPAVCEITVSLAGTAGTVESPNAQSATCVLEGSNNMAPIIAAAQTISSNTVVTEIAHGLAVGDAIVADSSGFTGITAGTVYYVESVPLATSFTVSTTLGGSVATVTGTSKSGVFTKATAIQSFSLAFNAIPTKTFQVFDVQQLVRVPYARMRVSAISGTGATVNASVRF
jgi:hypothetical protein